MDYNVLQVGGKFPQVAGHAEGCFFESTESGYMMILNFGRPTAEEIHSVSAESPMEIREIMLGGAIWITAKFGSMEWVDMPYHPRLSPAVCDVEPAENEGYTLTVVLVDAVDNTIKHLRMIGLGHAFSMGVRHDVAELMGRPFDARAYDMGVRKIMAAYDTRDLVGMCKNYYKLRV